MDRNTFDTLLKDLLSHLYDSIMLETHPLTAALDIPTDFRGRRGKFIRQKITEAIELLHPPVHPPNPDAPEWRAYQILYQRYIEGLSPPALATRLSISERQLRRDHSRAIEALSLRLWEQLFPPSDTSQSFEPLSAIEPITPDFTFNPIKLDLMRILNGVLEILGNRIRADELQVNLYIPPSTTWSVLADRIVLRQILFSIFSYAFRLQVSKQIDVNFSVVEDDILLEVGFDVSEMWIEADKHQETDIIKTAQSWGGKMNARLEKTAPPIGKSGRMNLALSLPSANRDVILVIDDQKTTLRMYQRYLSRTSLKIIGIDDPTQAIKTVRDLCPALILLDVMMPLVDGWEILQSLRSNAQTNQIPIIVCSAWEASDLARSLGAVNFLKKPITQHDLLEALEQTGLITENSA